MKNISVRHWNKKGNTQYHKSDLGNVEIISESSIIIVDNFRGLGSTMEGLDEPRIKIIINGIRYEFDNFYKLQQQLQK